MSKEGKQEQSGRHGVFKERANHHSVNGAGGTQNTEVLLSSEVCLSEVGDHKSTGMHNLSAYVILSSSTEKIKCRDTEENS